MTTTDALTQYHALVEEASRRTAAVRALPVGSQERRDALAALETWRRDVMRPADTRLWPLVAAQGAGHNVSMR